MIYSADFWIKKRKELWDEKKDIELDSQMRKALAKEIIENKTRCAVFSERGAA